MQPDPSFKQALKISYQLLSYRPRSVFEITTKLNEKGYDKGLIEKVIEHLKRLHYLDDKEFAKFWVEAKMKVKPVGSLVLRKDLKEKGLDEELVEKAINKKETDYDEFEVALKIAEKRLNYYGKIHPALAHKGGVHKLKAKKRIYDYLVRRGFKFSTAREVLKELFGV